MVPAAGQKAWSGGGREELVHELRRLIALSVQATAPPEVLAEVAAQAASLADRLDLHVPPPEAVPTGMFAPRSIPMERVTTLASAMPFDMIVGACNPLALPITLELKPPKAFGRGLFTAAYEGAPGCVHGAAVAAAFDLILTAANVIANAAGPTVELSIRYLKPTVLAEPALFEAWVTSAGERRTFSEGRLIQEGVVKVEASGEFVNLDWDRINSMHKAGSKRPSPDQGGAGGEPGTTGPDSLES